MPDELMNLEVSPPKNPAQLGAILNCLLNPRHTQSGTVRLPIWMEPKWCHMETTDLPQYICHLLFKKLFHFTFSHSCLTPSYRQLQCWNKFTPHMATLWLARHTSSLGEICKQARNRAHFPLDDVICEGVCCRLQRGKGLAIRKKKFIGSNLLIQL